MFYLGPLNVPVTMTIDNVILRGLSAQERAVDYSGGTYPAIVIPASSPAMDNNNTLVYVGQSNSFEMLGSAELTGNWNAGDISGATIADLAAGDGGAARVAGGIFRMTGANTRVHHNYAVRFAGGVSCWGGTNGQVIMSGENAEVSWNATSATGGIGGILADAAASYFEMSGNHAKINWNQGGDASPGGGLQVFTAGTVGVMSGDYAEIAHNYTGDTGGGLFVGTGTQFTMSGAHAAIKENAAPESNRFGGGVSVRGSFFMEAGEISGNTAVYNAPTHNNLTVRDDAPAAVFTGSKAWIGGVEVPLGNMMPSLKQDGVNGDTPPAKLLYGTLDGGAIRVEK
jgi:hypothetical protein